MNLKERVRLSLAKRAGRVVLRRELEHFGSPSQLSQILQDLQRQGVLSRLGEGIYAKTSADDTPGSVHALTVEVLRKADIPTTRCQITDHEIVVQVVDGARKERRLKIEGRPVRFERVPRFGTAMPEHLKDLPTQEVAQYVRRLASAHRVSYRPSRLEAWAEGVTRAAGDQVRTDHTDGLLIRLKQRKVLDDRQFTQLLVNHHRESKRV